jgi:3-methyladenine DNA glycosylase AlkD
MPLTKQNIDALVAETVRAVHALPVRDTPSIRAVRRELSKKLQRENARDVVAVGKRLIDRGLRWVGYEVISKHRGALESLTVREVEALGRGVHSWDTVDAFGCLLAGPVYLRKQISDADVVRWARSKDVWWRRTALVATTVLNSKGAGGDAKRTIKIMTLLIDDREDTIVKAMSWALRSLAARKPAAAKTFLKENIDRLAARVIRETKHKLEHGVKNKRKE